jgi:hypothetical protein
MTREKRLVDWGEVICVQMRLSAPIFRNCAWPQTIFIRKTRNLADDPEDFGSCVDPVELLSH